MSLLYDISFIFVALLTLGITIFVHELGHFLAAKRRGLVIKRFSIGFGPKIFGWERDGVEYRLSLIPFGGYVALPQLADMGRLEGAEEQISEKEKERDENEEEEEKEDENGDEHKIEQFSKISYADKMIVSVMGAVFNVLFAFVLSCILWFFGYDVSSAQLSTEVGYVSEEVERWNPLIQEGETVRGPGMVAGLVPGDKILKVDNAVVEDFMDIQNRIVTGKRTREDGERLVTLLIDRNGTSKSLDIRPEVVSREEFRIIGIGPRETFFVEELTPGLPGEAAGLEIGDMPVAIDGKAILSFRFLIDYLDKLEENASVAFTVSKGGEDGPIKSYALTPTVKEIEQGDEMVKRTLIGFRPKQKIVTTYPNPMHLIYGRVKDMYLTLSGLVSPQSDVKLRNMSGPVGIVNHLSIFAKIGFKKLLWFVVFINVNLAILNLLPIPVLDGGHMLFATIEKLRGQPLPLAFLERAQILFVALLFSFMLYVTFFDLQRLFPF
ncbi:MAG: RIP metalloprotease RseP [Opitutae bacterium]|nr:RIP metalloprotease RseP [Opitutae bacterium]